MEILSAANDSISLEELVMEPLVLMPKHTNVYTLALNSCHRAGFEPNVLQCARIETILSNVEIGACSSLLMKKVCNVFHSRNIKVVPIRPKVISRVVAAINTAANVKQSTIDLCEFLSNNYKSSRQ